MACSLIGKTQLLFHFPARGTRILFIEYLREKRGKSGSAGHGKISLDNQEKKKEKKLEFDQKKEEARALKDGFMGSRPLTDTLRLSR